MLSSWIANISCFWLYPILPSRILLWVAAEGTPQLGISVAPAEGVGFGAQTRSPTFDPYYICYVRLGPGMFTRATLNPGLKGLGT